MDDTTDNTIDKLAQIQSLDDTLLKASHPNRQRWINITNKYYDDSGWCGWETILLRDPVEFDWLLNCAKELE